MPPQASLKDFVGDMIDGFEKRAYPPDEAAKMDMVRGELEHLAALRAATEQEATE